MVLDVLPKINIKKKDAGGRVSKKKRRLLNFYLKARSARKENVTVQSSLGSLNSECATTTKSQYKRKYLYTSFNRFKTLLLLLLFLVPTLDEPIKVIPVHLASPAAP